MTGAHVGDRKRDRGREGVMLRQYAALPWRRGRHGRIEVMMVTSRGRGRWILPKGWRVKGKTPAQSAATEACEEAGVSGFVDEEPIGSYSCFWEGGDGRELREVVVYGLEVVATLADWAEKGQRRRAWMPLPEAARAAGEPGLARIIEGLASRSLREREPSAAPVALHAFA
jgi:NUDIX domain.